MTNVSAVVSSIRNIMRQDRGISGDAQRLEQLGWMLFLKIIDDKDQELEVIKDNYVSVIPEKFQWRNWATNPEGITGDELINFIDSNELVNKGLFLSLREIKSTSNPKRAMIVKEVFDGTNNYMKSGYEMRKVINKLNEIDFTKSEDKHIFGNIYESILQELRDAGNKGEYYTPRAVTQLMTMMTNPKLGEKVLDPAAGTGGFLTAAIDHVRDTYVKTVDDEALLQNSITGWELKPVAYVLGLTNLILHEIDIPDYHYIDSLKKEYNSIGKKDQVDVILANPPFGASIADGVETNFPSTYRCKESADLFVILMLQLLKPNGRCAIVLPDGSITGEGVKARIREKLLTDCNLHTIIRLPQTTFFPALVSTNLLFFEKGSPTNEIWYYEHNLPVGQKSYSKTKPIQFDEFNPIINWWHNRSESKVSWKVNINDIKDWNLDIKNPNQEIQELGNANNHYASFIKGDDAFQKLLNEIATEIHLTKNPLLKSLIEEKHYLFRKGEVIKLLRQSILQAAIQGELTEDWRIANPHISSAKGILKQAKEFKNRLVESKTIRKEKPLPNTLLNETPFEVPSNWVWSLLDDISVINGGYAFKSSSYIEEGVRVIRISDFDENGFKNERIVRYEYSDELEPFLLNEKNILMAMTGGTVGKSLFVNSLPEKMVVNQRVATIKINEPILEAYINCVIPTRLIQDVVQEAKNSTNDNISMTDIRGFKIPIPPIEEQKEIIEKVEALLEKCRTLEITIIESETNSDMLMKSILKEVFETKIEEV